MICTPRGFRRACLLAAAGLLASGRVAAAPAGDLIAKAREALAHGDGIAAEVNLRGALAQGAEREAVAADMGEAFLDQKAPEKAREWLSRGVFTPDTAARGFRHLAELEQMEGNLAVAGKAFDRAMAITPRDATMWVEIGRLRYAGGEHMLAIEAADYALKLDPRNVRALEFKGQFVRDSAGGAAALPWFERAILLQPRDVAVLGEYAATLGDLGRARDMLAVTRRMLEIEPGNARAYYLQAVLAARAGKPQLARGLLARTGDTLDALPAKQLLEGVLELASGNYVLAAQALSNLARDQPGNARVQLLLARADALAREDGLVVHDYGEAAARAEASPYLLTLVARSWEAQGRRDLAAPLLDRAALARRPDAYPVALGSEIGGMLAAGRSGDAQAAMAEDLARNPGSATVQALAGDVRLAAGDGASALAHYRLSAYVRMTESLLLRMVHASLQAGRADEAAALAAEFLARNPASPVAARLVAGEAARAGDWPRARLLLENVRANGGASDAALLGDLTFAQIQTGDAAAAEATAGAGYALQRGSPAAARAWSVALSAVGRKPQAAALLAKSRRMQGEP